MEVWINTKHSHKLCEDLHFVLQNLDLGGELRFFGGHVLEDHEELIDALAVDEDGACEVDGLQVVAKGVAAGDRKGLDIRETLAEEQRIEGGAPGILGQGLFGGGNHHREFCQVRELRLEDVRGASDIRAELKLVKVEALVDGGLVLEECKMQADMAQVADDFLVGRVPVDGVVAFGVGVRGTHGLVVCKNPKIRGNFKGFFFGIFGFVCVCCRYNLGVFLYEEICKRKEEICSQHHAERGEQQCVHECVGSCSEEGARGQ